MVEESENEPTALQDWRMFFPQATLRQKELRDTEGKLTHYTRAETALSIIEHEEVWLRNANLMNDFNEIAHGFHCVNFGLKTRGGAAVGRMIDNAHDGLFTEVQNEINSILPLIRSDTYLMCLSKHESAEDRDGRLSMWRAYAPKNGVALILNNGPFLRPSDALKAYTSPVEYSDVGDFEKYFIDLYNSLSSHQSHFETLDRSVVKQYLITAFRFAICSTKHPGFREE